MRFLRCNTAAGGRRSGLSADIVRSSGSMMRVLETGQNGQARSTAARLVFLNRYFYLDHSATSQMLSAVAFALARYGWQVSVITSDQRYDVPSARLPAFEVCSGVEVHRVGTSRFGRTGLSGRAADYMTFCVSAGRQLRRIVTSGDIVISKTDPPMLSVVVGPIAKRRGASHINWLQDLFPEVAEGVDLGGRIMRPVYARLRQMRNRSLRTADCNVVIGEGMARRLMDLGIGREHIRVIPNMADARLIRPIARDENALRAEWGLGDAFVVGYSGNLGRAHEIETLLAAIESGERSGASNGGPPLRWLFIGGGSGYARLQSEVTRCGLSSVRFENYQPSSRLSESLSAADVHLVSLRPELEGLIVPSKIYGVMAAGRPAIFIGDHEGEIARLLGHHRCGLTVQQGHAAALTATIERLRADPVACREIGAAARSAVEQSYDIPKVTEQWHLLLSEIAHTASNAEAVSSQPRKS